MRTAADMGIKTVAVFSDADAQALFVSKADEAVCIGGALRCDSYLNQDKNNCRRKINRCRCHTSGLRIFYQRNSSFSKRCKDEGIVFIGPAAEVIEVMGSKISAKEIMKKAGVPVVPGYNGADQTPARFKQESRKKSDFRSC